MKKKKLIAPIIITILMGGYYLLFAVLCMHLAFPLPVKILGIVIPAALLGVVLYVFIQRVKEIRSGEEDDLSQY